MAKSKKYTMRVYTNTAKNNMNRRHTVEHRVFWTDIHIGKYVKHLMDSIPDNHGFDQSRKTKIVRGKKNVWPVPKSKGNRF